jgi:hypothetical protein
MVLLLVTLICFLDSRALAARFGYGQWLANLLMLATFLIIHRAAPPRLKLIMENGLLVGVLGEVFFSLIVGMYEYRLANVPLYIPPGHSILYAAVYYFVREPWVLRNKGWLAPLMLTVGVGYAAFWLVARNDVYGALCTTFYVYLIWRFPDSRLFFLTMFLLVAYLEQVGTSFACWSWPASIFGKFDFLPSANPPSGISVFYFGFDVACLELVGQRRPQLKERHQRLLARLQRRFKPPVAAVEQDQAGAPAE